VNGFLIILVTIPVSNSLTLLQQIKTDRLGRYNHPMPDNEPLPLEFDELLAAEYAYIAQTANQANEDRARVSSFYLIAVGSLFVAIFGTQLFDPIFFTKTVKLMFSGLFILLTLLGTSTIMQLARLRAAWYESAQAMNQLKDFMVSQNESLAEAFRWKSSTLPPKYKTNSVSYYQAIEVALIGGLMFGATIFFLQQALFSRIGPLNWIVSSVSGLSIIYIQLFLYKRSLT
jgi:hypothetical protein